MEGKRRQGCGYFMESWPLALLLDGMCSCEMLSAVKRQCALPESHIRCRFHAWPCLLDADGARQRKAQAYLGLHQGPRPAYIAASDLLVPRFILLSYPPAN